MRVSSNYALYRIHAVIKRAELIDPAMEEARQEVERKIGKADKLLSKLTRDDGWWDGIRWV